jgi:hypothetical protein
MEMKKSILYLVLLIIISGCSHRIVRTGYRINKSEYRKCEIAIHKHMHISDSLLKVGEIELGESGSSSACSETDALEILKNEGCALNANVINITQEKMPDLMSSCYRCRAEFYRFAAQGMKVQNLNPDSVNDRIANDNKRNSGLFMMAAIVGLLFGFLVL